MRLWHVRDMMTAGMASAVRLTASRRELARKQGSQPVLVAGDRANRLRLPNTLRGVTVQHRPGMSRSLLSSGRVLQDRDALTLGLVLAGWHRGSVVARLDNRLRTECRLERCSNGGALRRCRISVDGELGSRKIEA